LVEVRGIEPLSERPLGWLSTRLAKLYFYVTYPALRERVTLASLFLGDRALASLTPCLEN